MMYSIYFLIIFSSNHKIESIKKIRDIALRYNIQELSGLKDAKDFVEGKVFNTYYKDIACVLKESFYDRVVVRNQEGEILELSDLNDTFVSSKKTSSTEATDIELKDLTLFIDASAWYKTLDDQGKKYVDVLTKMLIRLSK